MMQVGLLFHDRHSKDARLSQIWACFAVQAGAAPVGAALCRDGARSGPANLCCEAENLGPLRAPSRHKAAPTGIARRLKV
ncbi:protein of unknown function [Pseudomonas sp. JV551A1]|uniref:Uncharacterized protein n=1 Tax=Pseudomonas inefficax TaxID=2078786 RepID=A0AAQ1SW67_9PSED|nr:protein of unknown function [Pseudomonas sp. JV551A1]SPO62984.1 protein of unknown function [Pseudomonas inefficax]